MKRLLQNSIAALALFSTSLLAAPSASDVLAALKEGNARFTEGTSTHPNQDAARRTTVAGGQTPMASILSCSDSRVPVEVLFDQGLGDLFVVRVAGNVAATDEIGSIEYGVGHLNTPLLIVMGHTSCGAVKAVLEGADVHGSIPKLVEPIIPAATKAKASKLSGAALVSTAVKFNVLTSIDDIFKNSEEVRHLVKAGKLSVVGAVYDLESGKVNWLGAHPEEARLLAYTSGEEAEPEGERGAKAQHEAAPAIAPVVVKESSHTAWFVGGFFLVCAVGYGIQFFTKTTMQDWTIGRRLFAGFGFQCGFVVLLSVIAYEGLHSTGDGFTEYRSHARNSVLAGRIQANFLKMRIDVKDYLLTKKSANVAEYNERKSKVLAFLEEAKAEIHEPERKAMVASITSSVAEHAELFQQLQKATGSSALAEINKKIAPVGAAIDELSEKLKLSLVAEQNQVGPAVKNKIRDTLALTFWLCVATLILCIYAAYAIAKSITGPLTELAAEIGENVNRVTDATGEIADIGTSLAAGATQQAASLSESSASLEEISAMSKRSTDNANEGAELGKQARESAASGLERIAQLAKTLESIKLAVADMRSAVTETQSSSQEIGKIIKTIDEIAFQTNLLALNAAVEAARAGEAGMGFAVVADEVRALAQRSAQAAKDTAEKIEIAIKRSELGSVASNKLAHSLTEVEATSKLIEETFNGIAGQIKGLDAVVSNIAAASNEQSIGISQVNEAVNMLDQTTQQNAANAERNAQAASEMAGQAEELSENLEDLRHIVVGHPKEEAPKRHALKSSGRENMRALPSSQRERTHRGSRR
ncbi:MAG: methyl-accepting chemotaxis protein [Verrucomicrobiota bacterium]